MKDIVFATNNAHKLRELREITAGVLNVLSLADINCHEDIPETAETIEGNAQIKAMEAAALDDDWDDDDWD